MKINDLFTNREANACTGIFGCGMQSLEDQEDLFKIIGVDTDAVICYGEQGLVPFYFSPYMYDRCFVLLSELNAVFDEK